MWRDTSAVLTQFRPSAVLHLEQRRHACREAIRAIPDVAREVLPEDGPEKVISASVRDEAGTTLFRAVLAFRCEWPGQRSTSNRDQSAPAFSPAITEGNTHE